MNATELATLSMSQLRELCASHAIEVVGDKRAKSTYILAIETFQSEQTVIDLPLMEAAEMAERSTTPLDLYVESGGSPSTSSIGESIVQPTTPQPTPPPLVPTTQHHGASIVVLIPLILLSLAIISIRIIGALIPLIAAVGRLSVAVWGSIPRTLDPGSIRIDYFPA